MRFARSYKKTDFTNYKGGEVEEAGKCIFKYVLIGKKYPDEESCIAHFRKVKEPKGSHDCKQCHSRLTLRSGTVMESSKLPFRYWLYAIYLMTMTKKGLSALELQRQRRKMMSRRKEGEATRGRVKWW